MTDLNRRSVLTLGVATAAALTLPRAVFAQADDRPEVTVAVQKVSNSNTLEMLSEQSNVGARIYTSYAEPLIGTNWVGDMSLKPSIATSWSRIDDYTIEVELRDDVKFHNGDLLTAEDVAFTFGPDRMWGGGTIAVPEAVIAASRRALPAFDRVELLSPTKLRFHNSIIDPCLRGVLPAPSAWSSTSAPSWKPETG